MKLWRRLYAAATAGLRRVTGEAHSMMENALTILIIFSIQLSQTETSEILTETGAARLKFFLNFFFNNIIVLTLKRPKKCRIFQNLQ